MFSGSVVRDGGEGADVGDGLLDAADMVAHKGEPVRGFAQVYFLWMLLGVAYHLHEIG